VKSRIDYKEIAKVVDFLEARNLVEFELETEGFRIKLRREVPESRHFRKQEVSPPAAGEVENPSPAGGEAPGEKDRLHYITSPMVGTFYRAPDPSSPPFVEIGETVKKNQTLCIIEAMKLMNEIESDIDGVLEEIYVQNGKPVEFGKKLFAIRPLD